MTTPLPPPPLPPPTEPMINDLIIKSNHRFQTVLATILTVLLITSIVAATMIGRSVSSSIDETRSIATKVDRNITSLSEDVNNNRAFR